ncbi:MAG: alpha/beta hydrolase [Alphaproteobacteria bacterium]|nr:MAG: alpha/beta hydrolase [Alphaproteobacteria bacterium]
MKRKWDAREISKQLLWLLILTYLGVVGSLYLLQNYMIFRNYGGPPDLAATALPRLKEIHIPVFLCDQLKPDCKPSELLSWYTPPIRPGMPTILYFHGNGGNIAKRPRIAGQFLEQGWGLFMLEYRGYGGNPGKPTPDGLVVDAKVAYKYLRRELGPNAPIHIYGESIGGAVAIQMMDQNPDIKIDSLVLYAPFTRLGDVVKYLYPWLPVDLILKYDFNNIDRIKNIHTPLYIMHGEIDNFVPVQMGRKLFDAANNPKQIWIDPDSNHYSLWRQGGVKKAIEFYSKQAR